MNKDAYDRGFWMGIQVGCQACTLIVVTIYAIGKML